MTLPEYKDIKIRVMQNDKLEVLDILRHRFVTLTPEEWVRQHFINYLITEKGYPAALMANEVELRIGEKRLRCDSLLFGKDRQPKMVMEYKAETVALTDEVIKQVTTYNMLLHVSYLIISNGDQHYCLCYDKTENTWRISKQIPNYSELEI